LCLFLNRRTNNVWEYGTRLQVFNVCAAPVSVEIFGSTTTAQRPCDFFTGACPTVSCWFQISQFLPLQIAIAPIPPVSPIYLQYRHHHFFLIAPPTHHHFSKFANLCYTNPRTCSSKSTMCSIRGCSPNTVKSRK
jgi:hypothetical protein